MPKPHYKLKTFLAGLCLILSSLSLVHAGSLEGFWSHDNHPTKVKAQGPNQFLFCNETHLCAPGFFVGFNKIRVPGWQVDGVVSNHGKRIHWSNNTTWIKNSHYPIRRFSISGPWHHQGKPTFIKMSPDGIHFTLTNEEGAATFGFINEHNELVLSSIGVQGRLSSDSRVIHWSNQTTWQRY